MSRRTDRVAEQLRAEIARVLRERISDPRIGLVTVTRVDVSPDLRQALVFWSALDSTDEASIERVADGLDSAAPFVRRQLAEALPLKRTPELTFRYDPSLSLGTETLALIDSLGDDETP
jgi:ribosome-binding factor A